MKEYNKFYKACFRGCAAISFGFGCLYGLILLDKTRKLILEDYRI